MAGDIEMRAAGQKPEDDNWVRLTSTDGFSFMVKRKVATASGTLRNMLSSNFTESLTQTCAIEERGAVVEKVCEYMAFKTYYDNASANASVEIPVNEFMERIPPEVALELLLVADYLDGIVQTVISWRI